VLHASKGFRNIAKPALGLLIPSLVLEILCFLCGQVHAEHGDAIFMAQLSTFDAGITGPEGHAISRPAVLEVLSRCAELEQGMARRWRPQNIS